MLKVKQRTDDDTYFIRWQWIYGISLDSEMYSSREGSSKIATNLEDCDMSYDVIKIEVSDGKE